MRPGTIAAIVVTQTILITLAQAQSSRPGASSAPLPEQSACAPESGGPRSGETTGGSRTLSDQLSQSKGVICPPAGVDPGISAPPLAGGRTPIIPPPGTPGGDPYIEPK